MLSKTSWRTIPLFAFAMLLGGCDRDVKTGTEYQAVFMDNGQVLFGKLESSNTAYPVLRDAYYVQNQVNPETKQTISRLVARTGELHAPDMTVLNRTHIVVIEPVGADSRVAQAIKQAKSDASTAK